MIEEQKNEQILEKDEIVFTTDVEKDGKQYFQSLAHQLAGHICKKEHEEFRLTCEFHFLSATIYLERILSKGGWFSSTKYDEKKCIGVLLFDIDTNRITLRKTNVEPEKHEFHKDEKRQMDDCFGVQYEIFKYLRDSDLIHIYTIERPVRKKIRVLYAISKLKAVRNGRFLHFKGWGTQFFIPKADFKRTELGEYKEKRKKKGKK